jgi:hypothetical protein
MVKVGTRSFPFIICMATAVHLIWAICIYVDDSALNATALSALFQFFHSEMDARWVTSLYVSFWLLISAAFAFMGLWIVQQWATVLFLPQLILLWMSATGSFDAVFLGHFADGVERSRTFITADQIWPMALAVFYSAALIAQASRRRINGHR